MKKLTKEEAAELNELFETSNFKPEMSGLSLYTTLTQINSKTIKPGENNLRLISIQGTEKISKEHIEKTVKLIDAYLATLEKARGRFSDSNAEIDEQIKIIKEHRANFAEILK